MQSKKAKEQKPLAIECLLIGFFPTRTSILVANINYNVLKDATAIHILNVFTSDCQCTSYLQKMFQIYL